MLSMNLFRTQNNLRRRLFQKRSICLSRVVAVPETPKLPTSFSKVTGKEGRSSSYTVKQRPREDEIDFQRMREYRLNRIRSELIKHDASAFLMFDPINIRYATDTSNMSIFHLHNFGRYCFIPVEGPVVLFEMGGCKHMSQDFKLVDEIRQAIFWEYILTLNHYEKKLMEMVNQIKDLLNRHCEGNNRIAIDTLDGPGFMAFHSMGLDVLDGKMVAVKAREIKNEDELICMKASIEAAELGLQEVRNGIKVGITEEELWAEFHKVNIAQGGEWIETRLLSSGVRTNPWYSECSNKIIEPRDIVAIDTDMIGPYGYCADISRTFVEGHQFTSNQKKLYELALKQLDHNIPLVKPGVSLREFQEKSFKLDDKYIANRYSCTFHGVGLCDESPFGTYAEDGEVSEGYLKENMTICMESYIGEEGGKEGVKLENQFVIRKHGLELLSHFPFEQF